MADVRKLIDELGDLEEMLSNLGYTVALAAMGSEDAAIGAIPLLQGALKHVVGAIDDVQAKLDDICTGLMLMTQDDKATSGRKKKEVTA